MFVYFCAGGAPREGVSGMTAAATPHGATNAPEYEIAGPLDDYENQDAVLRSGVLLIWAELRFRLDQSSIIFIAR